VSEEQAEQKRRRRRRRGGGGGGGDRPPGDRPPQQQPQQQSQQPREPRPPQQQREQRPPREPQRNQPARPESKGPVPAHTLPVPADDELEASEPRFVPEPEDHGPAPAIDLKADLPADPVADLDPASAHVLDRDDDGAALLAEPVAQVVGIRFASAGKILLHDGGDQRYQRGERVVVDSDRGPRLATVAVESVRRPADARQLRRVLRRASPGDLRNETAAEEQGKAALLIAKGKARDLDLAIKVFRVEAPPGGGKKLYVYFTCDERIDLRDFLREMGVATGARIELRQIGARDEAKMIGGIGSCGQELCCTTWLPEMVPVSIKMAKDQGLVLNPTKVSGQCGRLKCCLVYEQATYAEMRKGLPKLGKRVITPHGEGRVVEVDVLRQRIRVTTGPGEFHVLGAGDVKPMFPSQGKPEPEETEETETPEPE
jgi:cell fate regulator YaaT (PSP1 superfamily)